MPRFLTIERTRLFPRSTGDGELPPLTIFCAPMGMGKTVLASQWVRSDRFAGIEVRWVDCSDANGDAERFWGILRDALGEAGARADERRQPGSEAAGRAVEQLGHQLMIVLDDYETITSASVDRELARIISLSPLLRVAVVARSVAVLDGPMVGGGLTVAQVEGPFGFSLEEARELAGGYGIDGEEYVARLHRETVGWPLPIRLVLQQVASGTTEGRITAQVRRFIEEYVADSISPLAIRILALSAVCDLSSLETMGEAVGASPDEVDVAIEELNRLGVMTRHWYPERTRLQCHPGFRDSLRRRAEREFSADELRRLRHRHALELRIDDRARSVALLLEIEEYGDAARTLAEFYPEGIGADGEALHPLRGVPLTRLREYPYLIGAHLLTEIWQGRCTRAEAAEMHRVFVEAIAERERSGGCDLSIPTQALLIAVERMRGNLEEALRLARGLSEQLEHARVAGDEAAAAGISSAGVPVIYAVIAISALLTGDVGLAERCFTRSLEAAERVGSGAKQHRALNGLAFVVAAKGETRRARGFLGRIEALELVMDEEPSQFSVMSGVSARLMIAIEDRDLTEIERLLGVVAHVQNRTSEWPFFAMGEAELLRRQDVLAAVARLDQRMRDAERIFDASSFAGVWLDAYAARMLAKAGNHGAAERRLAALDPGHTAVLVSRAALSLLEGDRAAAIATADTFLRPRLPVWETIAGYSVRSIARWELGERDAALVDFTAAAELVLEHGSVTALEMVPYESLREIADEAAARGGPDIGAVVAGIPEALRYRQFEPLTAAELRTLEALGNGSRTMAEAAQELFVTPHTVKFHMRSVYRKLGAGGRDEALRRARQMGLIAAEQAPEYHL